MSLFQWLFPIAPPAIEIELTAQLVSGSAAVGIIGVVAAAIGVQAALNHDPSSAAFVFSIALVAGARVLVLRRLRRRHGTHPPDLPTARRWQRDFALGSYTTSLLIAGANLFALSYRDPPLALLTVCALCCYVFSLILRTAMRPLVCLPSVAMTLLPTSAGLLLFLNEGSRLSPAFALAALATVVVILTLSCVQLTGHLYRTTLNQLLAQRDLMRFARQDPLTGLDNRLALRERFELLSLRATRSIALLYLDLDGFKLVNDVQGHQVGDSLLRGVAIRLAACLLPGESVFRMGGDEFIVLSRVRQRSDAAAIARRLLAALSEPYILDGVTLRVGASIGIALGDAIDADLDDLAASADTALYDAKRNDRGTFRFLKDATALRLIA